MAKIKQMVAEHFDENMKLLQFAFQMTMPEDRLAKERDHFRPEWSYGLFDEEDRLLSRLAILPFEAWIRGRKLPMGGIAGVASWPDARRQGGVRQLLLHAFARMREQGQSISMLAPFSFAFYRKFGYEMTIERKKYTLETKHLPPRVETPGSVRIVAKQGADLESLKAVYAAFAAQFDGTLARDEQVWNIGVLSKPGIAAVYSDEAGQPQGYMLYEVAERTMKVHDWAAVTEDARRALWSYAANHDSMITQLTITVPSEDPLSFLVPDPRFKQEIEPYFMSRIVDAESFVSQYPFAESSSADELTIRLDDAQAPWNAGTFRLRIEADGSANLASLSDPKKQASGGDEANDRLSCDIATLTAMLVGGRRPEWLHRIGRLNGPRELAERLERRVPAQKPYLADFF